MGIRTGSDYVASLRDSREVWLDGDRIADVTADPRLRAMPLSLAELYDLQHLPEFAARLTFSSPTTGASVGLSHIQPRSAVDLRRRRDMVKIWMDRVGGMMGRTPDFINVMVAAFAAGHAYFASSRAAFGQNILAYHEHIRARDLALTHSLVTPEIDKSKPIFAQPGDIAMKVVRETDTGIIVSGARSIATLAPFADEILIFPSPARIAPSEDSARYVVGFAVPVATPGLRVICRPSLVMPGARVTDHPLSARMDEMDAVVWFDNVLVPWERVFLYRDLEAANRIRMLAASHGMHQTNTKNLAKAEFLLGIALTVAESTRADRQPQVQNLLAEMINGVETIRGLLRASEVDCVPGPENTVLPDEQPLWAIRAMFPAFNARMVEILQLLGAGNLVLAPGVAELAGGAGGAVAAYCAGAALPAERRLALLRLAWDASCSGFAGRQVLYERFFSGDPWRAAVTRAETYAHTGALKERVWDFLDRSAAWDERLR
jgi:4-hydroxyphenylacetate 3-monooxygenase oxygenase component